MGRALPHLLLAVAAVELAVYRLAIPALGPTDGEPPPIWHAVLSYVGLFLFYFATALGLGIVVRQLVLFARNEHPYGRWAGTALVVAGAGLTAYAVKAMIAIPSEDDTLMLELFFTAALFVVVAGQLRPGGDLATKIGILFLAAPLLVHFYRDAAVRWVFGPEALWEGIADRVDAYGQWSMVLAALMSPYCFAPRPFSDSAGRLAPLAIGTFVGLVGALVMRQSYEVGYLLAKRGLGIDLGAGAPSSQIALYLIALGSITWTFVSCVMAAAPARRRIGIGLGLVVASGYAFAWPLQYVVGLVGFLTISDGAREVAEQEKSTRSFAAARFRPPPIRSDAWHSYIGALVAALRGRGYHASTVSIEDREDAAPGEGEARSAVPDGEEAGGVSRTHVLLLRAAPCPIRLFIERHEGSIRVMEIVCGRDPRSLGLPAWTLEARSERRFAGGQHPPAPPIRGSHHRTGDAEFDRRFRLRDAGDHTERLFDDGLRARSIALLDGWMAFWPGDALVYQLCPGQGTPLDTPIPVTQLAFGGGGPATADRMVTTLELVAAIAARALGDSWEQGPAPADSFDAERLDEPEPEPTA
ncbi:MAG TPA: hypothetical protein VFU21_14920 [Kofleriaceae bacterium]|nr:hypothetical protein [Kofleriaceae bacterium]